MEAVAISPKFQIVIPKAVRRELGLSVGQRLEAFLQGNTIHFTPEKTLKSLKGRWPGLDAKVLRESDRVSSQ